MEVTVIALAAELCGTGEDDALLQTLCAAAEQMWNARLVAGVTAGDCGGALRCAAAFTAAADYLGKRCAGAESFTVGDVTVKQAAGQTAAALAKELRETAARLMEPYAVSGTFCFKGVRG